MGFTDSGLIPPIWYLKLTLNNSLSSKSQWSVFFRLWIWAPWANLLIKPRGLFEENLFFEFGEEVAPCCISTVMRDICDWIDCHSYRTVVCMKLRGLFVTSCCVQYVYDTIYNYWMISKYTLNNILFLQNIIQCILRNHSIIVLSHRGRDAWRGEGRWQGDRGDKIRRFGFWTFMIGRQQGLKISCCNF